MEGSITQKDNFPRGHCRLLTRRFYMTHYLMKKDFTLPETKTPCTLYMIYLEHHIPMYSKAVPSEECTKDLERNLNYSLYVKCNKSLETLLSEGWTNLFKKDMITTSDLITTLRNYHDCLLQP